MNQHFDRFVKEISQELSVDAMVVAEVCKSEFSFVKYVIERGNLENVRLPGFGAFAVTKKKLRELNYRPDPQKKDTNLMSHEIAERELKYPKTSSNKTKLEVIEEMNKLYKRGWDGKRIGKKLGICGSTVLGYITNKRPQGTSIRKIKEIRLLDKQGLTRKEVAKRAGVSGKTVLKYTPKRHNKVRKLSEEKISEIKSLYKQGFYKIQIAEKTGVCVQTVSLYLKHEPVVRQSKTTPISYKKIEKIMDLREEGLLQREIAEKLGINRRTVEKYLKENFIA